MKSIFVLLASLMFSVGAFAFNAGQTPAQVATEVAQRKTQGQTADQIAAAAVAAGLPQNLLQSVTVAIAGSFPPGQQGSAISTLASAIANSNPTAAGPGGGGGGGGFTGFSGAGGFSQSRGGSIGGSPKSCVSKCGA
jgi:hypothetical protein